MKFVLLIFTLFGGTIIMTLIAQIPDGWIKDTVAWPAWKRKWLGIGISFSATVALLVYFAVTGKSIDETVACSALWFTDHCKAAAQEELVARATPMRPMILSQGMRDRASVKALSQDERQRLQAENCAKAQSPKPPQDPVIDVNGIYPGMPFDEAAEVLRCLYPDEDVTTQGRFAQIGGRQVKLATATVRYGGITPTGAATRKGVLELVYDDLGPAREVLSVDHQFYYGDDELHHSQTMDAAIRRKYGQQSTFDGVYVFGPDGRLQREQTADVGTIGGLSPAQAAAIRKNRERNDRLRACRDFTKATERALDNVCGVTLSYDLRETGADFKVIGVAVMRRALARNARVLEQSATAMRGIF